MSPHISWPQGVWLILMLLHIARHARKNRLPREGHYDLGFALIDVTLTAGLLWWGGFFGC